MVRKDQNRFGGSSINYENSQPIVITAIYRPPSSNLNMFLDEFET